ncbi:MAG TPA: lipopolysaccharide biosynthesis protein [Gemmatimonadales bacterium]|nr:lipopolysaccharide biosynthesis protein [Gemmatimonadales bacterium]
MPPHLVRQVGLYAVANGVPALVNFAGIALLTRLLEPEEYGRYALLVATVAVVNAVGFQWLRSGARRFLAAYHGQREELLPALGAGYAAVFLGIAVVTLAFALWLDERAWLAPSGLALALLLAQTWYELNAEFVLADVNPVRYGAAGLTRAAVFVTLAALLASAGLGASGVLLAAIAGYALPGAGLTLFYWRGLRRLAPSRPVLRTLTAYGIPLTASYGLQFVMDFGDRLLLGWLRDPAAVGVYAVAYDLTQQTLNILLIVVNLAAVPLAVQALETGGAAAATARLRQQAVLLALLGIPGAVGFGVLAPEIGATLLGREFSAAAARLVPVIAIGAFCCGFKAFYFDLAFQLAKDTRPLVWIGAVGAALNVGLNLLLIPRHGPLGAAWATAITFGVAVGLSARLGLRRFHLPLPWWDWGKIAFITLLMVVVVRFAARGPATGVALALPLASGLVTVAAGAIALDVGGVRQWLRREGGVTEGATQ